MKRVAFFTSCLALGYVVGVVASAQETPIFWANRLVSSTEVELPENSLDAPDGVHSHFLGAGPIAVYSGFSTGDVTLASTGELSVLLNIVEESLAKADFITFEHNGTSGVPYESSTWTFDDGQSSVTLHHDHYNPSSSYPVMSIVGITTTAYADFFGFVDPYASGDIQALVFDLDGIDVTSPSFQVTLEANGSGAESPDPDAYGVIANLPLILSVEPSDVTEGDDMTFTTVGGDLGNLCMLAVFDVGGAPFFEVVTKGTFDADCEWTFQATVPAGLAGLSATLGSIGIGKSGFPELTNFQEVIFH